MVNKAQFQKTRSNRSKKRCIDVIGIGLGPDDLTPKHRAIIDRAEILVGGRRLLAFFSGLPAEKKVIGKDLDEVIAYLRRRMARKSIVVLASGDPLFYGIGAKLVAGLGPDRVTIHSNVSSVAAAFARIKEPWGGVRVLSLHGRVNSGELFAALAEEDRVAVLTDPGHTPAWLARRVLAKLGGGFRLAVMEALGTAFERHGWYTLAAAAERVFREPNIALLQRLAGSNTGRRPLTLGTPEVEFEHERGVVTKSEVRAVTLSKLRLSPGQVLWDLGAGSGSVAIESSLLIGGGRIVAVEKEARRIEQIKANAKRFGVRNLRIVQAVLPDELRGLPRPDRVFIGGGGRDLRAIIAAAARRLKPDGILVVNTVLRQSVHDAEAALRRLGFATETVQVLVLRSAPMPWSERLEALNPVWIITGTRKAEFGSAKAEGRKNELQ
jgi:precorrin-6B C5,15-methyltransferase / cobalt-precorrin-6B C5,C15-methyltransferase